MIIIYGRPGCGACENVKNLLNKKSIEYTYVDISQMDEHGRDVVINDAQAANKFALPLIVQNGEFLSIAQVLA